MPAPMTLTAPKPSKRVTRSPKPPPEPLTSAARRAAGSSWMFSRESTTVSPSSAPERSAED